MKSKVEQRRVVLFDMAGTIFSSPVDWERENRAGATRVSALLKKQGYTFTAQDVVDRLLAEGRKRRQHAKTHRDEYQLEDVITQVLRVIDIHLDESVLSRAVREYLGPELTITTPFPGANDTLRKLHEEGYTLILLSNTPARAFVEESLTRYNMRHYFSHVFISADIGYRKPHPKFLEYVRKRVPINQDNAIFVGDRLHDDIGSARALGIPGILFTNRDHPDNERYKGRIIPDQVINNFNELHVVIRELLPPHA